MRLPKVDRKANKRSKKTIITFAGTKPKKGLGCRVTNCLFYSFISYFLTSFLLSPSTAWPKIGETTEQVESSKGKPTLNRNINDQIVWFFYKTDFIEEVIILIQGKTELILNQKTNADDFTKDEIDTFLNNNISYKNAKWIPINESTNETGKFYRLLGGNDVIGCWEDKRVMVASPEGIKAFKENEEAFNVFFDQLKGEVNILQQEAGIINKELQQQDFEINVIEKGIRDPKEAVLYAQEQRKKGAKYDFPFYFAAEWHKKNPKEYMEWARTLRKNEYDLALQCTYETKENGATDEADDYVVKVMARGTKRNQAIEVIAFKKALNDPKEAAEWATQLGTDDEARISALNMVAMKWAYLEPEKTIDWVVDISDTLPSELTGNSTSISAFFTLTKLFERNPELAFQKATELKNPDVRNPEVFRIAGMWAGKNMNDLKKEITRLDDKEKVKPAVMGLVDGASKMKDPGFPEIANWLLSVEQFPQKGPAPCGDLFSILFSKWIRSDGDGCMKWVEQTLDKRRATNLQKTAILGYLDSVRKSFK